MFDVDLCTAAAGSYLLTTTTCQIRFSDHHYVVVLATVG
jgi:hypothetical protein